MATKKASPAKKAPTKKATTKKITARVVKNGDLTFRNEEYPSCCGMYVLNWFRLNPNTNKKPPYTCSADEASRIIDDRTHGAESDDGNYVTLPAMTAITAHDRTFLVNSQEMAACVLKAAGFKQAKKWKNPFSGSTLILWTRGPKKVKY